MNYYLSGEITDKVLIDFINFTNEYKENNINIFINSVGGNLAISKGLVYIINQEPIRFKLIALSGIYSSAFTMFLECKCEKIILDNCKGMYHLSHIDLNISTNKKGTYFEDEFIKSQLDYYYNEEINFGSKLNLTQSQMINLKAGKEIFFNTKQLRELIKLEF